MFYLDIIFYSELCIISLTRYLSQIMQINNIDDFLIPNNEVKLLGGKYGIATNGISHEDVGSVEVIENHQPMQELAGISFSDKAAINLKLKSHMDLPRRSRRRLLMAAARGGMGRRIVRHGCHARFPEHHHPQDQHRLG